MPLLRKRRPSPKLLQATRSPMPQMFQQALRIGGTDQENEGQEVDLVDDRGWAGTRLGPSAFQKDSSKIECRHGDLVLTPKIKPTCTEIHERTLRTIRRQKGKARVVFHHDDTVAKRDFGSRGVGTNDMSL
jgi:hypothetical protein